MDKLETIDKSRAALLMMHFQTDVFSVLKGSLPKDMLDRANSLIRDWRATGRPVVFANFFLGANYEAVTETNMLTTNISKFGIFRDATPVGGLDIQLGDKLYTCPRASVFFGTDIDKDLKAQGIDTLVMAGIATTGVLFSTVAWASDADYRIYLKKDCCFDPDSEAHESMFRTSFATRALII